MELANRRELESQLHKRISRLSKRHKRELRELLGSPPDPSNVPPAFWDRVKREMQEETVALLVLLFGVSSRQHIRSVGAEFDPVRLQVLQQAQAFGREQSEKLSGKYSGRSREKFQRKAAEWETQKQEVERARQPIPPLPDSAPSDIPRPKKKPKPVTKKQRDEDTDAIFSDGDSERLAVNGTTEALTGGGETGVGLTVGVSQNDLWINRPWMSRSGPCPICKPLHGTPRRVWGVRYPDGPGESVHSHCVCTIQYEAETKRKSA